MKNKIYKVLGVMSGTSLDGIDIAYLQLEEGSSWKYSIISAETINYSKDWFTKLKNISNLTVEEIRKLDESYTEYLAEVISGFIEKNKITELDAVCSHGHTALHQPENGLTLQIGNLPKLAKLIRQKVVCDFRVKDVNLGGQGAPLVPIGDQLLFGEYDYCLNLGGFANISTEANKNRIAYDICPVNIILNEYASKLGFNYDEDGKLAENAEADQKLLQLLNNLEYYNQKPPKSLGIEWVKKEIFLPLEASRLSSEEILATFTQHISIQLSKNIENNSVKKVLVTGGGAFNKYLIELLQQQTKAQIMLPGKKLIEHKEALIFGFLGVLKLRDEVNVLSSVTGAKKDHSSGKIYSP